MNQGTPSEQSTIVILALVLDLERLNAARSRHRAVMQMGSIL